MIKEDILIIVTGIVKDAFRLVLGLFIYGLDLELTGKFFAELAPIFIILGWAENVDSEYLLDPKTDAKSRTNFYLFLGLALISYYIIIFSDLLFFILTYFTLRLGYMYYKTEMLEVNEHRKLMMQKIFEIFLLLILVTFHSYIKVEWVICIFLVLPAIPSLTDPIRISYFNVSAFSQFSMSKVRVITKARSISLIFKNFTGNIDVVVLTYLGNPEGAGLVKYIKSLGNGQNLIINQVIDRYRRSYIMTLVESRQSGMLLLLVAALLCFGFTFGVLLINIFLPLLTQIVVAPKLPYMVIIYFMLLAASPIMRVTYLYSSSMKINLMAQLIIAIGIYFLFFIEYDQPAVYLIFPVAAGLIVFVANVLAMK